MQSVTPVFQARAIVQALFVSKCFWHFLAGAVVNLLFKLRVLGYYTAALAYYVYVIPGFSFLESDLPPEAKE